MKFVYSELDQLQEEALNKTNLEPSIRIDTIIHAHKQKECLMKAEARAMREINRLRDWLKD